MRLPDGRMPHIMLKEGDVAQYVLAPGPPERAQRASELLDKCERKMFHREYLAFTGTYKDVPVSVISTGMGCPAVAIGIEELAAIGANTFIRIGSCGAIRGDVNIGDCVIASGALREESTSVHYAPVGFPAIPNLEVLVALIKSAKDLRWPYHVGLVRSFDAFYRPPTTQSIEQLRQLGVIAGDMESSALFCIGSALALRTGTVNCVGGNPKYNRYRGEKLEEYSKGEEMMLKIALEAIVKLDRSQLSDII
jgi:uridine phosphorylase